MKSWIKIVLFCLMAFVFIGCDRITKNLAKEHLQNQEPTTYFHDTFRLEYVENTGAALSLGDNLPKGVSFWVLSIFPLILMLALFAYIIKNISKMSFMKLFSFTLIFSGGIGNIIDRMVFDRHVTDFMNLGFLNIRTGIFNVADIFVTAGAIGLLLFYKEKASVGIKEALPTSHKDGLF